MSIVDTITDLSGGVKSSLGGAANITELSNQIIAATAGPISLAQGAAASAVASITNFANLPGQILGEVTNATAIVDNLLSGSGVSDLIDKTIGNLPGISAGVAAQFESVIGDITGGMGDMVSSIQGALTANISEALGGLSNLDIAGNFTQITDVLAEGISSTIGDALGNLNIPGLDISGISDKISAAVKEVISSEDVLAGGDFGDELAEKIGTALEDVPDNVPKEAIATATAAATEAVAQNITQAPSSGETNAMIHWFTRGEDVPFALVAAKRAGITTGVKKALADTWDEPKTEFAPVYPYNKVFMSESNHIFEIDDTPGVERLHWFHRRGNFEEWFPDGKRVLKVVDKNYEVMMKDDHKHVQGHAHLSTEGRYHLFTKGEYYIENIGQSVWVDYTRTTIIAPLISLNP